MLDAIGWMIYGALCALLIGFTIPKFAIWGLLLTSVTSIIYYLTPGYRSTTVIDTMTPRLAQIPMIIPRAISGAAGEMGAQHGVIGVIVLGVVVVMMAIPFVIGLWLGVTRWPELYLLRAIF